MYTRAWSIQNVQTLIYSFFFLRMAMISVSVYSLKYVKYGKLSKFPERMHLISKPDLQVSHHMVCFQLIFRVFARALSQSLFDFAYSSPAFSYSFSLSLFLFVLRLSTYLRNTSIDLVCILLPAWLPRWCSYYHTLLTCGETWVRFLLGTTCFSFHVRCLSEVMLHSVRLWNFIYSFKISIVFLKRS